MHQADRGAVARKTAVKVNALNQRAGTIADANNGDTNLIHA
jgi:hypothetical protein